MTNEEMIEKLEQDGLSALSDMEFITNALEENTNLKAENDRLSSDNAWLVLNKSEKEFENIDLLKYSAKLKAEIEQLKSTISEMETTTAQEDDLK